MGLSIYWISDNISTSYYLCIVIPYGIFLDINCLYLYVTHIPHRSYITFYYITLILGPPSFCLVGCGVGDRVLVHVTIHGSGWSVGVPSVISASERWQVETPAMVRQALDLEGAPGAPTSLVRRPG